MYFTEQQMREIRVRLNRGVAGARAAGPAHTAPHNHQASEIEGGADLAAANVFTGNVNYFEQVHANVSISTDGFLDIEEGRITASLLTSARSYELPDDDGTFMLTTDPPAAHTHTAADLSGVTKTPGSYAAAAQSGSIAAQALVAGAGALYRVSVYVVASASAAGVLTATVAWNDGVAAQSEAVLAALPIAANGMANAEVELYAASGNVTIATTLVSGTMTYNLYSVVERMT